MQRRLQPSTEPSLVLRRREGAVEATGAARHEARGARGPWAAWRWDGETLQAGNCPFGFRPLFYRELPDGIALATRVGPLARLAPRPQLDLRALSVFLRIGFFLGEDTPFAGIRALPPNGALRWTPAAGLRLRRGDRPAARPARLSRAEAVRTYGRLFERAVREALPADGRIVVPLSGGQDSRHIACALVAIGCRPDGYVTVAPFPGRSNEDVEIAGEIARRHGVPHTVVPQPWVPGGNFVRTLACTSHCADEHAWLMPLADHLAGRPETVFDGLAGDVMSAGLFDAPALGMSEPYRAGRIDEAARAVLRFWDRSRCLRLLPEPLRSLLPETVALERVREEMALYAANPNLARAFHFWNRTRREVALAPFGLLEGTRVATPYLDPELWAFLESLPHEFTADRRLHAETIVAAFPRWADVRFEDKAAPAVRWSRARLAALRADLALRLLAEVRPASCAGLRQWSRALRFAFDGIRAGAYWNAALAFLVLRIGGYPTGASLARTRERD